MRSLCTAIAPLVILAAGAAEAQVLSIGTTPQGTSTYATGAAIAKVLSANTKLKMRVAPRGGPNITIPLINQGQLDFGVSISIPQVAATRGSLMFKNRPQKNLRLVATFHGLPVTFMVRRDSQFKKIADLRGARVSTGFVAQRVVAVLTRATLASASLTLKDIKAVPAPNTGRAADDLVANKTDAHINTMASAKSRQTDAAIGIRWLPVPDTPKSQKIAKTLGLVITTLSPSPAFAGVTAPVRVYEGPTVLTANAKVPDEVVYEVAKVLHANKKALAAAFKGFRRFDPARIAQNIGMTYHPGAAKYFKENGLMK